MRWNKTEFDLCDELKKKKDLELDGKVMSEKLTKLEVAAGKSIGRVTDGGSALPQQHRFPTQHEHYDSNSRPIFHGLFFVRLFEVWTVNTEQSAAPLKKEKEKEKENCKWTDESG